MPEPMNSKGQGPRGLPPKLPGQGPQGVPPAKRPAGNKNLLMVLLLALVAVALVNLYSVEGKDKKLSRTEFLQLMADSTIKVTELKLQAVPDGIAITGKRLLTSGELAEAKAKPQPTGFGTLKAPEEDGIRPFETQLLEADHALISEWEKAKAPLKVQIIHDTSGWVGHLFAFLPVLLLIGLFWFMMMRQNGQAGGKGIFSFGRSRAAWKAQPNVRAVLPVPCDVPEFIRRVTSLLRG